MRYFLKNNIVEMLTILLVVFGFSVLVLSLLGKIKAENVIAIEILATVKILLITMVNYYFGSSRGSKSKQEKIDSLTKKNEV